MEKKQDKSPRKIRKSGAVYLEAAQRPVGGPRTSEWNSPPVIDLRRRLKKREKEREPGSGARGLGYRCMGWSNETKIIPNANSCRCVGSGDAVSLFHLALIHPSGQ